MGFLTVSEQKISVNNTILLVLYAVIPFSAMIVIIDHLLLDKVLLDLYLPDNPKEWAIWAAIFNFPHVIASYLTLADSEYMAKYKKRFSKALAIIVTIVVLIIWVAPVYLPAPFAKGLYSVMVLILAIYTMYHVLSQQFSIGMMLMKVRPAGKEFELWRWSSTIAATLMYGLVFTTAASPESAAYRASVEQIILTISGLLVITSAFAGFNLIKKSQRKIGSLYVIFNIVMITSVFVFLVLGYKIFVIAIPRFIHDFTAFVIYCIHDQNRNYKVRHNYLYRALAFIPLPPLLLCPILAFGIANSISSIFSDSFFASLLIICGLFHYYIEGIIWKREGKHRDSVPFS